MINDFSLKFIESIKRIVNEKGCWIPIGHLNNGYGEVTIHGKRIYLHRVSAVIYLGLNRYDLKIQVNHKPACNDRRCFNPEHIYIGTQTDNYRDLITTKTHRNVAKVCCPKCGGPYSFYCHGPRTGKWSRYCKPCKKKRVLDRKNGIKI